MAAQAAQMPFEIIDVLTSADVELLVQAGYRYTFNGISRKADGSLAGVDDYVCITIDGESVAQDLTAGKKCIVPSMGGLAQILGEQVPEQAGPIRKLLLRAVGDSVKLCIVVTPGLA